MKPDLDQKTAENMGEPKSASMRRAIMVRLKAKPMLIAIAALVLIISCSAGITVIYTMGAVKSISANVEKKSRSIAAAFGLTIDEVLVTGRIETPAQSITCSPRCEAGRSDFRVRPP